MGFRDKAVNKKKKAITAGKTILVISAACFVIGGFLFFTKEVLAQGGVVVEDPWMKFEAEKAAAAAKAKWSWEDAINKLWEQNKQLAGAAFNKAVGYFLNQLAYDTATYLATGDKGQKPMFYTEGWGEYLKNVSDNAAGTFLEELGRKGVYGVKFNLCEPDFGVQVKIGLGLQKTANPREPECTFSKMQENWAEELNSPDFLNRFQSMFNPWENDLGIALTLHTGMEQAVSQDVNDYTKDRVEGLGFKPVTDPIKSFIKTPAKAVFEHYKVVVRDANTKQLTFTGTLADAIDTFTNTLIGKLMRKWLVEGLVSNKPDNSYKGDWGGFSDYYAGGGSGYGGIAGAKNRFRELIEPEFGVRGDYKILNELVTCPNPDKAGPTNCVITDNFREAVTNNLTVGQAMTEGYLKANGLFGFTADDLEPPYNEGYPYRSMIILRKFRILPVGWELAAQYIKDMEAQAYNLEDMVACYDSADDYDGYYNDWCAGLVDPNWVLKAPLNYCKREGPGPEIASESITGEGEDSELQISRNDNYCADEQACIKETSGGDCELYGYCTEERRKWDFNADTCAPRYNTCATYRGRDGQTVSYLANTLDYGVCNYGNAGCLGYCEDLELDYSTTIVDTVRTITVTQGGNTWPYDPAEAFNLGTAEDFYGYDSLSRSAAGPINGYNAANESVLYLHNDGSQYDIGFVHHDLGSGGQPTVTETIYIRDSVGSELIPGGLTVSEAMFRTAENGAVFYAYQHGVGANHSTNNDTLLNRSAQNRSIIYLHEDTSADPEGYDIGFVHDVPVSTVIITEEITISQNNTPVATYDLPNAAFTGGVTGNSAADFYNYVPYAFTNPDFHAAYTEVDRSNIFIHQENDIYTIGFTHDYPNSVMDPDYYNDQLGLIGHWQFDNNLNDSINGNNGALTSGSGYGAGARAWTGQSINFDGLDDYVEIAHNPVFEVANGTIMLWVRIDDFNLDRNSDGMPDVQAIVHKDRSMCDDGVNLTDFDCGHFHISYNANMSAEWRNRISVRHQNDGNGAHYEVLSELGAIVEGTWHHIAVTFSDPDGLRLYIDGVQQGPGSVGIYHIGYNDTTWNEPGTADGTVEGMENNQEPWALGAHYDVYNPPADVSFQYLDGALDDFRIYRRALTADEIEAIYSNRPTNDGSYGIFTFDSINGPATVVLMDDLTGNGPGYEPWVNPEIVFQPERNIGDQLAAGDQWRWFHGAQYTDGVMLAMPAGTPGSSHSWSITLTPNFMHGITYWHFVASDGSDPSIPSLTDPITITYTRTVSATNDGSGGRIDFTAPDSSSFSVREADDDGWDGAEWTDDLPAAVYDPIPASSWWGWEHPETETDGLVLLMRDLTGNDECSITIDPNDFDAGRITEWYFITPTNDYDLGAFLGDINQPVTIVFERTETWPLGSEGRFTFSNVQAGIGSMAAAVVDDPGEAGAPTVGATINNGNTWAWSHDETETDGGVITIPSGDNWSITIAPNFTQGITDWHFLYNASNDVPLNLTQAVTISLTTTNVTTTNVRDYWTCTQTSGNKLYLDKDAEDCKSTAEGCHEFIHFVEGEGANLVRNSGFEDDLAAWNYALIEPGTSYIETVDDESHSGARSLHLYYDGTNAAGTPPDYLDREYVEARQMIDYIRAGIPITISYYVKTDQHISIGSDFTLFVYFRDRDDNQIFYDPTEGRLAPYDSISWWMEDEVYESNGEWTYVSYTIKPPAGTERIHLTARVQYEIGNAWLDDVKMEYGDSATAYSDYREQGLIYQKLAPDYLECDGVDDPAACGDFVYRCPETEVGCDLYTSLTDRFSVPARVVSYDYCAAECVGYDSYIQSATAFAQAQDDYFIPQTSERCSSQAAGCDEFTNLDKLGEGAEAREYYKELRQCRKPDAACASFYTWEGSAESGFQLRVHEFENNGGEPAVTSPDGAECNELIYSLPATHPEHNSDCREFYNRGGDLSYHLYSRTIMCADNCHPYRRTLTDNPGTGNCLNGGVWNAQHGACIYMAIPGQGQPCSAAQAGCREYNGSMGANMRILFTDNFEDGTSMDWTGVNSTESLLVSEHSLEVTGLRTEKNVGTAVTLNRAYVIRFLAKGNGAANFIQIGLGEAAPEAAFTLGATLLDSEWRLYEYNLPVLNNAAGNFAVTENTNLYIFADGNFYIDDIRLIEISDRYYIIKDSWQTPDACLNDIYNVYAGELHNLGCDAYRDRGGLTHNLRRFSSLCSEAFIGCEMMINTHNYSDYREAIWNDGNDDGACLEADEASEPDCEYVPADSYDFIVYDKKKQCNLSDKGCQRLGKPAPYGNSVFYTDVYYKNDPDKYSSILCAEAADGCEEWTVANGTSYFKYPGDQACEWRQGYEEAVDSWNWYKKKVKRCDENEDGEINALTETRLCLSAEDCVDGLCITDKTDYLCPYDAHKTIGLGGPGSVITQPNIDTDLNYWAGLCPAEQAGCGEYIDPVSRFSTNVIFNPDFSDIDGDGTPGDGWSANTQGVELEPFTLYRLGADDTAVNWLTLTCPGFSTANQLYELDAVNNLRSIGGSATVNVSNNIASKLIYSSALTDCQVSVNNTSGKVELKPAILAYHLASGADKQSCNGLVDFEQGCVLFNERAQSGAFLAGLTWDADLTIDDANGVAPQPGIALERDANALIKVIPDRSCKEWLACRSYIKDEHDNNVCFDIGLCDSVDENGNCDSFLTSEKLNERHIGPGTAQAYSNTSGYAKVGNVYNASPNSLEADYYPLAAMEQAGNSANITNGGFELAGSNGYPIGWFMQGEAWNENEFIVISNPLATQEECVNLNCAYGVPEGNSFLKLGSTHAAISEFADVEENIEYVLTVYINTINLQEGQAKIAIRQYDHEGALLDSWTDLKAQASGLGWQAKLANFTALPRANRIKIKLYSSSGDSVGNFYYDGIKIRPALNVREEAGPQYLPQTCRLYPDDSALSCEYFEDSGVRRKGWYGYCLEYDRYPGAEDACVLWWPVDKVKGEGIEEGTGYNGRFPLYYTTHESIGVTSGITTHTQSLSTNLPPSGNRLGELSRPARSNEQGYRMENGELIYFHRDFIDRIDLYAYGFFTGYNGTFTLNAADNWDAKWCFYRCGVAMPNYDYASDNPPCPCAPDFHDCFVAARANFNAEGEFSGFDFRVTDRSSSADGYDGTVRITFYFKRIVAEQITQVVTPVGHNKYWSGRVYTGSNYISLCNQGTLISFLPQRCQYTGEDTVWPPAYTSDYTPFGSVVPPSGNLNIVGNPYEWDSKTGDDWEFNQPLIYELPDKSLSKPYQARLGQLHSAEAVQRIFAQSYGTWQWRGQGRCAGGTNDSGSCEQHDCLEGSCVDSGTEVCINSANNGDFCDPSGYNCPGTGDVCSFDEATSEYRCEISGDLCCLGSSASCEIADICSPSSINAGDSCDIINGNECPYGVCVSDGRYMRADSLCVGGSNDGAICNYSCPGGSCGTGANPICSGGSRNNEECDCSGGTCVGINWSPPDNMCNDSSGDNVRPGYDPIHMRCIASDGSPGDCYSHCDDPSDSDYKYCDWCAVVPIIGRPNIPGIRVNGSDGTTADSIDIIKNGFIDLTFVSDIDSQQLPLIMYALNWGDNEDTVVSGVEMRDRPSWDNPHQLYHLYSYWDLKAKHANNQNDASTPAGVEENTIFCGPAGGDAVNNFIADPAERDSGVDCPDRSNCCTLKPSVRIKDNWGWCNYGTERHDCDQWEQFAGWIRVMEK